MIIIKNWGPYIAQWLRVLADLVDTQGLVPDITHGSLHMYCAYGHILPLTPLENLKIINSKNKRKIFLKSKECKGNWGDLGQWGNPFIPERVVRVSCWGSNRCLHKQRFTPCVCLSCLWLYQLITLK